MNKKNWDKDNIIKLLSIISIILGIILIIIVFINIFYTFNEKVLTKDFYFLIGILFIFGLFGSELIGFVKQKIENFIKENSEKIITDKIKSNFKNKFDDTLINFFEKEENIEQILANKNFIDRINDKIEELNDNIDNNLNNDKSNNIDGNDTWKSAILKVIDNLGNNSFILNDIYKKLGDFIKTKPNNNTPKSTIRRQLQKLRNEKIIEFLGNGKYKKLK